MIVFFLGLEVHGIVFSVKWCSTTIFFSKYTPTNLRRNIFVNFFYKIITLRYHTSLSVISLLCLYFYVTDCWLIAFGSYQHYTVEAGRALAAREQAKIALELDAIAEESGYSYGMLEEAPKNAVATVTAVTAAAVCPPNDGKAAGAGKKTTPPPGPPKPKKPRKPTKSAYQEFGPLNMFGTNDKGKWPANDLLCTFVKEDNFFNLVI